MAGGALCWRQWREVGSGDELALVAVCVNMNGTGVNGTGVRYWCEWRTGGGLLAWATALNHRF